MNRESTAVVVPIGKVDNPSIGRSFPFWIIGVLLKSLAVGLLVCAVSLVLVVTAHASSDNVSLSEIRQGQLLFKTDRPDRYKSAPTLQTDVEIDVTGMVGRATVKQKFENPADDWIEGLYVFPLPENAAVDHMRMVVGERIIKGQIKEREEAKRTYNKAKQAGKKAALIEQERPNMFTTSVANIGPKESVTIEIEYQQTLQYDSGQFKLRFPMAVTPRFIPGTPVLREEIVDGFSGSGWAMNTNEVSDASRITPPYRASEEKINPLSLKINLNSGFEIEHLSSSYHKIDTTQISETKKSIKLAEGVVPSDRDFELVWSPKVGNAPKAALFTEQVKGDFYHLLMVLPPGQEEGDKQALSREIIYIIDTSGSMHGTSIEQAKSALRLALDRLHPNDLFNVIQFNSVTDQLFSTSRVANSRNIKSAKNYISSLSANGGTQMEPAIQAALINQGNERGIRQVVFLTDGSVGNESALYGLIENNLGYTRLFTVGIGSAPNSYFMRKAAQFGRGTFTYIGDVNEVKNKMEELFIKLESPVMSDLQVKFEGGAEVWPRQTPDLYLGEPLVITAKALNNKGKVSITGQRLNEQWKLAMPLKGGEEKGVGVLWARKKIGSLMDGLHSGSPKDKVREEVVDVALTHHLVSKYTSLVAVDVTPSRPMEQTLNKRNIPQNLPRGQSHEKIFGRLAQTATLAQLYLWLGLALLLIAFTMRKEICSK